MMGYPGVMPTAAGVRPNATPPQAGLLPSLLTQVRAASASSVGNAYQPQFPTTPMSANTAATTPTPAVSSQIDNDQQMQQREKREAEERERRAAEEKETKRREAEEKERKRREAAKKEEDPKAKEEREAREKKKRKELKAKISKLIIQCLEYYYKQKRIASKEDFKYLSRTWTHKVMEKGKGEFNADKIRKFVHNYFQTNPGVYKRKEGEAERGHKKSRSGAGQGV